MGENRPNIHEIAVHAMAALLSNPAASREIARDVFAQNIAENAYGFAWSLVKEGTRYQETKP